MATSGTVDKPPHSLIASAWRLSMLTNRAVVFAASAFAASAFAASVVALSVVSASVLAVPAIGISAAGCGRTAEHATQSEAGDSDAARLESSTDQTDAAPAASSGGRVPAGVGDSGLAANPDGAVTATDPRRDASDNNQGDAGRGTEPGSLGDLQRDAQGDSERDLHPDYAWLPPRTVVADGEHKMAATAMQAWVHEYPDDETAYLGYFRAGRVIDRSEGWIAKTMRCPGGWYEVLPEGYLCRGNRATFDMNDPIVVASWKPARRGDPLPYGYVRPARRNTFLYFVLPTKAEQERTEGSLMSADSAGWLAAHQPNADVLGDPEPVPHFLTDGKRLPTPYGVVQRTRFSVHEGRANPKAAFAIMSVHEHEGRRFGLTTELDLIAIDRTKIVKAPARRGGEVDDLPAGIVRAFSIPRYLFDADDKPMKDGAFTQYQVISLTGASHRDMYEVNDGSYVPAGAVQMIDARTSFPSFASAGTKWVDVSLNKQILVAYEGRRAVYVAEISTGVGGASNPKETFATVQGSYTIRSKHLTATMTGNRQADDYELTDVPYVQYFHEGYALHATFWHDNFGRPQSHGCINLTPADAAWIFEFTEPKVPENWHGVVGHDRTRRSVIHVRP